MIEKELLEKYGVEIIQFSKGDYIFEKGKKAKYYFQIINDGVKMDYYNDNGNEFIQGIFGKNKSLGEPPLLIDTRYPTNAIAISDLTIFRLKKETFKELLLKNNSALFSLILKISTRLYYKATTANGMASNSPEEAILTLFKYLKFDVHESGLPFDLKIDFTRKNIVGLLGLSVEATIRTIKKWNLKIL